MIKLTERLAAIAGEIRQGEKVLDIGTDHGYLPLALWEKGISPHVIMSDISPGSLKKAEENCRHFFPETTFDIRLGSGLETVEKGEADCAVLAGMGGILIRDILAEDKNKSLAFKKIILQPRNNIGILRYWLLNNGFHISNEQLVREGKYICEILTAVPGERAVSRNLGEDRIEYQYPHTLIDFKGPLTEEYLQGKLNKEKSILEGMMRSTRQSPAALRSQKYRIDYLERLLEKI